MNRQISLLLMFIALFTGNSHVQTLKYKRTDFFGKFSGYLMALLTIIIVFINEQSKAQGTWTTLNNTAPDPNGGVMLLLSDGTVIAKAEGGSDFYGDIWDKLTPDIHGSYVNGTWTTIAPMHDTRLYFSSQVLMDGRVFIAGGEYGSGGFYAETYDPQTDKWTKAPNQGQFISDANSEILPDGRVLVALVATTNRTAIFNPVSNTWATGPICHGAHNESAWVKLPDNSILMVNFNVRTSERYIPSLNQWVVDATVPVSLYEPFSGETGAGFLLPDGRAFFLGASGHTAIYTPSGNTSRGTWIAGPNIPNAQGTPDAPGAMMVNGKIICAVSPIPNAGVLAPPTSFYEFDYLSNSFTQSNSPGGGSFSSFSPCYTTNMLDLPDGTVLYGEQGNTEYYVYSPDGTPLASGKPTINNITQNACSLFTITGTLFNGISEGAAYGDDGQMATNYPIVRLTSGTNVYYARTFNWNRTGVQTGTLADTTHFTVPSTLPHAMYSLVVVANGISSDPVSFIYRPCDIGNGNMFAYPNPSEGQVSVAFGVNDGGHYTIKLLDVLGKIIREETNEAIAGDNFHLIYLDGVAQGVYIIMLQKGDDVFKTKIVVK